MIWHVVPAHVYASKSQGSYKDVSGREELLAGMGKGYRRIVIHDDLPQEVSKWGKDGAPSYVLVEYSYFPRILEEIRARYPGVILGVRAHNIEPLQNLSDNTLTGIGKLLRTAYGTARLFAAEIRVCRACDYIYPISPWEGKRYWRHLPGKAKTVWLPYFTPCFVLPTVRCSLRRDTIACFPSSSKNRKSIDLVRRFLLFSQYSAARNSEYRLIITGDPAGWGFDIPDGVTSTGMISSLSDFMPRVRAVAVLSPRGYGFKTTIMDAIAAGAYVLLHPSLYRRCPSELREACIPMDSEKSRDIDRAFTTLEKDFPCAEINNVLKERARSILRRFAGES